MRGSGTPLQVDKCQDGKTGYKKGGPEGYIKHLKSMIAEKK